MRALFHFVESRTGIAAAIRTVATGKYPPRSTSWLHTFGFAAATLVVLQAGTGIALSFFYVPAADHAYDSIRYLERDVTGGALLRAMHHWGASAMAVLVFLHVLRVFFHGAYKRPRELTWLFGLGLLAVSIGFAFTGYLLPWDQKAYFATKVGVNIAGETPAIGPHIMAFLYGGEDIGPQTLNRFFALHVLVLPAALLVLLGLHLHQIQRHGVAPVGVPVDDPGERGGPYHPVHTFREAIVALVVIGGVVALAAWLGASLEAEASATDLEYEPRPDWYFFGAFELLKLFPGDQKVIGAFWVPAGIGFFLVLLPFVDRNPERRLSKRKLVVPLGALVAVAVFALTVRGALDHPRHPRIPSHPLGASPQVRLGYDLTRGEGCFSCHTMTTADGTVFGKERDDTDAPDLMDIEYEPEDLAEFLLDTGSDEMPSFPYLTETERIAIGVYLQSLRR